MYPIWDFGSEDQKEKYLPGMAKGDLVGCFGLTEPDYGSNPGDMITRAEDKGDHFLLNGAKMWITNGTISDLAVVWAKDEDDKLRKVRIYPEGSKSLNLAFDITPSKYITNLITERGICEASEEGLKNLFPEE